LKTDLKVLQSFLIHQNNLEVFAFSSDLNKIMKSINTISLAVDKASKVVKAFSIV
jgi:hypothetical protein